MATRSAFNPEAERKTTTEQREVLQHLIDIVGDDVELVPAGADKQPWVQWRDPVPPPSDVDHFGLLKQAEFIGVKLPADLWVIDLDHRTADVENVVDRLVSEHPDLHLTETRRGYHLWFRGQAPSSGLNLMLDGKHVGELKQRPGLVWVWAADGRYRHKLGKPVRSSTLPAGLEAASQRDRQTSDVDPDEWPTDPELQEVYLTQRIGRWVRQGLTRIEVKKLAWAMASEFVVHRADQPWTEEMVYAKVEHNYDDFKAKDQAADDEARAEFEAVYGERRDDQADDEWFKVETAEDNYSYEPTPSLVENEASVIVEQSAVGLVYGESGAGKTFVTLDLALSVHHGVPWMGCDVIKAKTLFVGYEGKRNLKARARAWGLDHHMGFDLPMVLNPTALQLNDVESVVQLGRYIERHQIRFVIIDTYGMAVGAGADENSNNEANTIVGRLKVIAERERCTIVLVHHTGKDGKSARGASALVQACDFVIKANPGDKSTGTLSLDKVRDGEAGYVLAAYELITVDLPDEKTQHGRQKRTKVVRQISEAEAKAMNGVTVPVVVAVLDKHGGRCTASQMRPLFTKYGEQAVRDVLDELISNGLVIEDGKNGGEAWKRTL